MFSIGFLVFPLGFFGIPVAPLGFRLFTCCFPNFTIRFLWNPGAFLCFQWFPQVFLWVLLSFPLRPLGHWFACARPWILLWISMVSYWIPWFFFGFPSVKLVVLLLSFGFQSISQVFLWFPSGFLWVALSSCYLSKVSCCFSVGPHVFPLIFLKFLLDLDY